MEQLYDPAMPSRLQDEHTVSHDLDNLLRELQTVPPALVRQRAYAPPPSTTHAEHTDPEWVQCDLLRECLSTLQQQQAYMDRIVRVVQATNHCVRDLLPKVEKIAESMPSNNYCPPSPIIRTSSPPY
jgi:hypothetical protein